MALRTGDAFGPYSEPAKPVTLPLGEAPRRRHLPPVCCPSPSLHCMHRVVPLLHLAGPTSWTPASSSPACLQAHCRPRHRWPPRHTLPTCLPASPSPAPEQLCPAPSHACSRAGPPTSQGPSGAPTIETITADPAGRLAVKINTYITGVLPPRPALLSLGSHRLWAAVRSGCQCAWLSEGAASKLQAQGVEGAKQLNPSPAPPSPRCTHTPSHRRLLFHGGTPGGRGGGQGGPRAIQWGKKIA